MARLTTPVGLWRLAISRSGRLTVLIALPLIALLTRNGWVAAGIILAGYAAGLVAVWVWRRLLVLARRAVGRAAHRQRDYVVPQELPTSPPFVGRSQELAALRKAMSERSDRPRVIVIHGPAGIGKSALALHFGQLVTEGFEDGQLFASLRRHGPSPPTGRASLVELLKDFITSIQTSQDPPPDEDLAALRERYVRLTRSRRLLVVLDDALSAELIHDLLPAGRGCLTLVTSRTPLVGLSATMELPLGPLPPAEGMHMFREIVGSGRISTPEEERYAEQIVRQSRCYPSALQLVGAMVSSRPAWSLAPVVRLLGQPGGTAGPALSPDALDLSYALLTEDERRATRQLGVLDESEPLAPWMLAALLGIPEPAARGLADRLVHAGLIGRADSETAGVTEYRVHDHVHAYARRLATDRGELNQLQARLDSARRDRATGRQFGAVQRRVQDLLGAGRLAEATTVASEAVAWALDQDAPGFQAVAQATLAELHIELGNLEAAEDLARQAEAAAVRAGDPLPRAQAMRAAGRLFRRLGQPATAVEHHTAALGALDAARQAGMDDRSDRIRLLRHRAAAYADSGQPALGLQDLDEAGRLDQLGADEADRLAQPGAPEARGGSMQAALAWARGMVVARLDRLGEAVTLLTEAAELAGDRQPLWRAWTVLDLARVETLAGLHQSALTNARHALEEFGRMSHRYGKAKSRLMIAQVRLAQGTAPPDPDPRDPLAAASAGLENALETFRNCGDRWIEATTAVELAVVRRRQGRVDDSAALLRTAVVSFTTAGDQVRADETRRLLRHRSSRRRLSRPEPVADPVGHGLRQAGG